MVSDWENNFMENKCNKWMRYRNILPRHKNTNLGLSTIHLVGVDMIKIANSTLIIETYFYMIWKRINSGLLAVETFGIEFINLHGLDMRDTYTNSIRNDNDVVIFKHKMNRIRWHMQLKQWFKE